MNKLRLQDGPFVVGTLSRLDPGIPLAGDVIEVRLDKTGHHGGWLERCKAIEAAGKPVLLTIRLREEGGDWPADNDDRLKLYQQGLHIVSAVDAELNSAIAEKLAKEAVTAGKACVLSFHDFEKTPALNELESVIQHAHQLGATAKVATMIRSEADIVVLKSLLARKWPQPVCVIAMGDAWKQTRIDFPKLGSCLTYGYLDKPTAPGQISAAELSRQVHGH